MQVATALSGSNIKRCTQDAGSIRQADSIPHQNKGCCFRRNKHLYEAAVNGPLSGKNSRFMMAPAVVMLITIIGSLSYYLVTPYFPAGNVLLAVTDLLLLA